MTVNIKKGGVDLATIFAPFVGGGNVGTIYNATTSNYESGGVDLSNLFANISYGTANSATGIKAGGSDLNTKYAALGTTKYTSTYSVAGTYTEAIPMGAITMVIEVWGGTGAGSPGTGINCGAEAGSGGGSGGYSKSTYTVTGQTLKNMTVNVGSGGTAPGGAGTQSNVASGTFSITTMTCNGGSGGSSGSGGAGGTASGGTNTNTTGNAGTLQGGPSAGGAAVTGTYGTGTAGGGGGLPGAGHPGANGNAGVVVFTYLA